MYSTDSEACYQLRVGSLRNEAYLGFTQGCLNEALENAVVAAIETQKEFDFLLGNTVYKAK